MIICLLFQVRLKRAVAVALARRRAQGRIEKLRAVMGRNGDAAAAAAAVMSRVDAAHGVGDNSERVGGYAVAPLQQPRCRAAAVTVAREPLYVAPLRAPKVYPFFSLQKLPEFQAVGYREFSVAATPSYPSIESARDLRIGAGDELMSIYSTPVGHHETAGKMAATAAAAAAATVVEGARAAKEAGDAAAKVASTKESESGGGGALYHFSCTHMTEYLYLYY